MTAYNQATELLVLLTAASGPKQDAAIRAQLFFDHMKDFDYIVPNAMSYKMLVKAYAKNEGDDTLDSIFNQLSSSLTISYYKVCLIF